jgi:radical SAM family uncharacterized protein
MALVKSGLAKSRETIGKLERLIGKNIGELFEIPKKPISISNNILEGKTVFTKPFESYLLQVEKPGRYIGCEQNAIVKAVSESGMRICMAFPDMYEIGMSWNGLQVLYHLMNSIEDVYCERVFAPAPDFEHLMRLEDLTLVTLETKTPVSSMDVVGFTLQYELSFTNILNMLNLAGIPARSSERKEGNYPILIAGGPCSFNPEPLAEVFDLFLIGDGEEAVKDICELYLRHKRSTGGGFNEKVYKEMQEFQLHDGLKYDKIHLIEEINLIDRSKAPIDKDSFLIAASDIQGVYVPSFYEPLFNDELKPAGFRTLDKQALGIIEKALVRDLDGAIVPTNPVIPLIETVQNRACVEIFRGCTRGCRFCQAGMIYRPVRERTPSLILEKTRELLNNTGHEELSLMSLSTSDYSEIGALASRLAMDCKEENVALSIPSLRMNEFSLKLLEEIQGYKKTGLTFAPEAGSQRMRDVINKNVTEEDILKSVSQAAAMGWHHIKLYFMIGLPGELEDDVLAIADIARRALNAAKWSRNKGKAFSLTVSVSNFVPKPHTPFQWVEQESQEALFEKVCLLKDIFNRTRGIKFQYHDTKASNVEALIARGDRRLLAVIEKAWELGCRFDSWQEHFDYSKWEEAFSTMGMSMASEGFEPDEVLPWDHIKCGVSKDFLLAEWEKSKIGETTQDCRDGCICCGLQER